MPGRLMAGGNWQNTRQLNDYMASMPTASTYQPCALLVGSFRGNLVSTVAKSEIGRWIAVVSATDMRCSAVVTNNLLRTLGARVAGMSMTYPLEH